MDLETIDLIGQFVTLFALLGGLAYTTAKIKFMTDLNDKAIIDLKGEFRNLTKEVIGLTVEIGKMSALASEMSTRLTRLEERVTHLESRLNADHNKRN